MPLQHPNNRYDLRNDMIFKIFFGNEKNLKPLKLLIEDLTGLEIEELSLISSEKIVRINGDDKNDYRKFIMDLLVETKDGRKINIEMQKAHQKGFLKRVAYYLSNVYIENYGKGEGSNPYDSLTPSISISILDYNEFEGDEAVSCFSLMDRLTHQDFIEKDFLSFYFIELAKKSSNPRLQLWIELLSQGELISEPTVEFEEIVMKPYDELQLTSSERREALLREMARADEIARREAYEEDIQKAMNEAMNKAVNEAVNEAVLKGEAIGLEKGLEKGELKGELKTKLEMAKSMQEQNIDKEVIRKVLGKDFEYLLDEISKHEIN